MIKAIIFDCFGVLYIHRGPEFAKTYIPPDKHQLLHDLDTRLNLGMLEQPEYEEAVAELCSLPVARVRAGLQAGFGRNENLLQYIFELKKQYKIGLLTNIGRDGIGAYFTPEELAKYFNATVLSGDVGFMKPHAESYMHMCQELSVKPSEAVMIDDNADNIAGAEAAGLQTVLYQGYSQTKPRLEAVLVQ